MHIVVSGPPRGFWFGAGKKPSLGLEKCSREFIYSKRAREEDRPLGLLRLLFSDRASSVQVSVGGNCEQTDSLRAIIT